MKRTKIRYMTLVPSGPPRLYREIARKIEGMIAAGALRAGDRIPSVRRMSGQQGVSVSTILRAYLILENQGWIEARPKSGYYVAPRRSNPLLEPSPTVVSAGAQEIHEPGIIQAILAGTAAPSAAPFGAAIPSCEMFPARKLARILGGIARTLGDQSVRYDPAPGSEALRRELARRSLEWGCHLRPDDFLVTNGATEAVSLALRLLCRPGDVIVAEAPSYFGVVGMLRELRLKVRPIPTHCADGLDLGALERAIADGKPAACVVTPNFNNPTGGLMSRQSKRLLVEILARRGIPLVEDDTYGDLNHEGTRPCCAKAFDREGGVLLCGSFSKTVAPGYRVGYLAAGRFLEKAVALKNITTLSGSTLAILSVAEFLKNGGYDRHLRFLRSTFRRNLLRMSKAIALSFPRSVRVSRPAGGFVLWIELPPEIDAIDLFRHATEQGIQLAPGPLFSVRADFRHFIRLNYGFRWNEQADEALAKLGFLVRQMAARKG